MTVKITDTDIVETINSKHFDEKDTRYSMIMSLIFWLIDDENLKSWEIRIIVRRCWNNKLHAADKTLHSIISTQKIRHREYKFDDRAERERSFTSNSELTQSIKKEFHSQVSMSSTYVSASSSIRDFTQQVSSLAKRTWSAANTLMQFLNEFAQQLASSLTIKSASNSNEILLSVNDFKATFCELEEAADFN